MFMSILRGFEKWSHWMSDFEHLLSLYRALSRQSNSLFFAEPAKCGVMAQYKLNAGKQLSQSITI